MSAARIDIPLLKVLRVEIDAALAAIATKHGIAIQAGKGTYGGTTGKIVLELAVPDGSGSTNPMHIKAAAHAEQVAVKIAGPRARGSRAYLEGHTYACMACQHALFGAGVISFSIVSAAQGPELFKAPERTET